MALDTLEDESTHIDQYVVIDDLRIRFRISGRRTDTPPLLLCNGIGASLELWDPLVEQLQARHQIIRFDHPGAGRSGAPHWMFGIRQFAAIAERLVTHLGLTAVDVLGLSFGGMVAQEFARRRPSRVRRLVLASTTCGWGGVPGRPFAMAILATPLRYYSRGFFELTARQLYGGNISRDPELLGKQWEKRHEFAPTPLGYATQLGAAWLWSSRRWLHELHLPVLVITGEHDPIVPRQNGRLLASKIPGAELVEIAGRGHLVAIEDALNVAPVVSDFLRRPSEVT